MSQSPSERTSRNLEPDQTATMIAHPPRLLHVRTDSREEKIYLRFASHIWNDYEPGTQDNIVSPPKLTLKLRLNAERKRKRKRIPSPIKTKHEPKAKVAKLSPKQRKQCKVKTVRFQYGGPDAKLGGKYQDMITLLQPCLQTTCANCWKWHAHSMRTTHHSISLDALQHPETAPLSPYVDSKIGNDQWQLVPTIFPKTRWRDSTKQDYIAKLTFGTNEGKAKFKALAHEQARKETKREQDRLRRLQKELARDFQQHLTSDNVETKPRGRHRLKLVFKTKKGQNNYRKLVVKYSQKGH